MNPDSDPYIKMEYEAQRDQIAAVSKIAHPSTGAVTSALGRTNIGSR